MIGKKGTNGARNGLSIFGFVLRSTITAIDTNIKAVIVPIFTKFANKFKSKSPAKSAARIPVIHVLRNGVWKRLCTLESFFGSNPSRLIEYDIRIKANMATKSTVVKPAMAPTDNKPAILSSPTIRNAYATGSATFNSVNGTIPVNTNETPI